MCTMSLKALSCTNLQACKPTITAHNSKVGQSSCHVNAGYYTCAMQCRYRLLGFCSNTP